MNHHDDRTAYTFAEIYRRARLAGSEERPPFDVQCGLAQLMAWMDQEVEPVVDDHPMRSTMHIPHLELRGRNELLDELAVLVRDPWKGPAVLAGVGGVGKSALAAVLAEQVRGRGRRVWWVSAADSASFSAGLATIAKQLGGSSYDVKAIGLGTADAPDRFWRLLDRMSDKWLLVFDNADDSRVLAAGESSPAGIQDSTGWVRPSRTGLVLVTSRETDPRMWTAARLYPVGWLKDADAAQVLRDLAPEAGDDDQARILARRLGGLPLALHLAGRYLSSKVARWPTFEAYDHAFGEGEEPSLRSRSGDQAPRGLTRTVTRTAEISLDGLASNGIPQARAVLRLASCYAPTPIPAGMFESRSVTDLLGSTPDTGDSRRLMENALRGLRSVGLVQNWSADPVVGDTALDVHPVLSDINRTMLDRAEPDAQVIRHAAVALLATAVKKLRFDLPEDWPRYRLLGQHLLALLYTTAQHVDQDHLTMLMGAVANTAGALNRSGAGKAVNTLCRTALTHGTALGNTHPTVLRVRHVLAWAVAYQGHLADAEAMFEDVLDTRQRVLGKNHPDTIESRHEVAWITACQGRWAEAEWRYQQTLRDSRHVLGADDPRTLTTRHELAWAIANQGRFNEAHKAFLKVLQDRRRVLGSQHQQTLTTHHEIAWTTAKQGKWAEAEGLYRDLLRLRQQILGADHPETLVAAHELAWTTARQGRLAEAQSLYEQVRERRHRTMGDDHPDTQMSIQAIAALESGHIVDAQHSS